MGQIGAQRFEIVDQPLLVIGDLKGIEEIIFEIEQIAEDRLLAKFPAGDGPVIVQLVVAQYLQTRQLFEALPEECIYGLIVSLLLQLVEKRPVSKICLKIDVLLVVDGGGVPA